MGSTSDTIAAMGLAIGGLLGMAGTCVASNAARGLWTIDGVASSWLLRCLTMNISGATMTSSRPVGSVVQVDKK